MSSNPPDVFVCVQYSVPSAGPLRECLGHEVTASEYQFLSSAVQRDSVIDGQMAHGLG